MTMTMDRMVLRLRGMLQAGQPEDLSELAEDYVAGSGTVVLRYPKRNLGPGSLICFGLVTFQAFEVSQDGTTIRGVPSVDGSPDADVPAGTLVRVKPIHTTWAMFDEMSGVLSALSAPQNGLFRVLAYSPTDVNRIDGTYVLPTLDATPLRLLSTRWRIAGTQATQQGGQAEWIPQDGTVRLYGALPLADEVEFLFAMPYGQPTDLSTDVASLGIDPGEEDVVLLGAAANLALSSEGRRVSVFSQGDARRSEEVPAGANIGVARMYAAQHRQRVDEMYAALTRLWPITRSGHPMFDQTHSVRWP